MLDAIHAPAHDEAHRRLELVLELRSAAERHLWTAFGAFWLANVGLLVALFASGDLPTDLVSYTVCGAGVVLSGVVWLVLLRAAAQVRHYTDLVHKLDGGGALLGPGAGGWRLLGMPPLSALVCAALWLIALALFAYASAVGGLFYLPLR